MCGSINFKNIAKKDRYNLWNPVAICKKCGLILANPRLTSASYEKFYRSDEYRLIYDEEAWHSDVLEQRYNVEYSQHIFKAILPFSRKRKLNKVLEFGCGGGWNLVPFFKNDFQIFGLDLSGYLVEVGRSKGLNLKVGSFDQIQGKYDIIILNHVIEHFTDLEANLLELKEYLSSAGLFYIAVPNMDNFGLGQLQNAHAYYFSPRTFIHYLSNIGFQCIEFGSCENIHMYGIFSLNNHHSKSKNDLHNEYKRVLKKIRFVKIKETIKIILSQVGLSNTATKVWRCFKSYTT